MVIMTAIVKELIVIAIAEDTDTARVEDPGWQHLSVLLWHFFSRWVFRLSLFDLLGLGILF